MICSVRAPVFASFNAVILHVLGFKGAFTFREMYLVRNMWAFPSSYDMCSCEKYQYWTELYQYVCNIGTRNKKVILDSAKMEFTGDAGTVHAGKKIR